MDEPPRTTVDPASWKTALVADVARVAARNRWGRALMAIGWVHLACFLACQSIYRRQVADPRHLAIWFGEVVALFVVMRRIAGRGWIRASPGAALVARVWGTFLILSFNVVSLNTLTGWSMAWSRPVWTTLSSFGFATMAWLFGLRFLIPAFQMYFTGLLLVRYPDWGYAIHGASWWAALQGIGLMLERHRIRQEAIPRVEPPTGVTVTPHPTRIPPELSPVEAGAAPAGRSHEPPGP